MKIIRSAIPVALIALLAACGGGGMAPTPPSQSAIAGTWTGTTTTELLDVQDTTFTFIEESGAVTGNVRLSGASGSGESPISGSLSDETLTLSTAITVEDASGNETNFNLVYEGTVSYSLYSGTVLVIAGGVEQGTGQFSVNKTGR